MTTSRFTPSLLLAALHIHVGGALLAGAPLLVRSPCRSTFAVSCVGSDDVDGSDVDGGDDFLRLLAAERSRFEMDEEVLRTIPHVWALLFNPGSGAEGIYSRKLPSSGTGLQTQGVDLVVTFEEMEDAERYAAMLSATDFPEATPSEVDTEALLEFCQEGGHILALARAGTLVVPPEVSVEQFEWSPGVSDEAEEQSQSDEELKEQRENLEALFGMASTVDTDESDSSESGEDRA